MDKQYFKDNFNIHDSWLDVLYPYLKDNFEKIKQEIISLSGSKYICPNYKDIFNCFNFDRHKLSVVLLGQDPYHTVQRKNMDGTLIEHRVANGLSFSYKKFGDSDNFIPESLKRMLREIHIEVYNMELYKNPKVFDPDLTRWSEQGVLLLNTALTVCEKEPGSHLKIWKDFTNFVLNYINNYESGIVFILLGNEAKKTNVNEFLNYRLESGHPSPLNTSSLGFSGKVFSEANDILLKNNGITILW